MVLTARGKHLHITDMRGNVPPPSGFYTILQSLQWMAKSRCLRTHIFQSPKEVRPSD